MYAKLLIGIAAVGVLAAMYLGGYYAGRSAAVEESDKLAIAVANKNKLETAKMQRANDQIARVFHETTIKSYQDEESLQADLRRLHERIQRVPVEASSDSSDCSGSSVPDADLPDRVRIIQQSVDSGRLPHSDHQPYPVKEAHEIEGYCVGVIFEYNRIAEQLDALITVVE